MEEHHMEGLHKIFFTLAITLVATVSHALTPTQAYEELHALKLSVKSAYVFALIVDMDARAHVKRNERLKEIETSAKTLENLEQLKSDQLKELTTRTHVYLRSAKGEAATYDINLGSRTVSNGFVAYSELIEQIDISMDAIKQQAQISEQALKTFNLMEKILNSVEVHSERAVKTQRSDAISQPMLNTMCSEVQSGLDTLAEIKGANTVVKKASMKWSFIKTPACQKAKTNAPYTIIYYGELLVAELQEFAVLDTP